MTKKIHPRASLICYTFPLEIWSPPSMQSHTFQGPLAPPSRAAHPLARLPCIRIYKNKFISLSQNHDNGHNMLMEINGRYWVPVSHNDPAPKISLPTYYYMLQFLLLMLLILVVISDYPTRNFHGFMYQAHNFH